MFHCRGSCTHRIVLDNTNISTLSKPVELSPLRWYSMHCCENLIEKSERPCCIMHCWGSLAAELDLGILVSPSVDVTRPVVNKISLHEWHKRSICPSG